MCTIGVHSYQVEESESLIGIPFFDHFWYFECIFLLSKHLLSIYYVHVGIFQVIEMFLLFMSFLTRTWVYANKGALEGSPDSFRIRTSTSKTMIWSQGWDFEPVQQFLRKRDSRNWVQFHGQWFSQSHLPNETPTGNSGLWNFLVGLQVGVLGKWYGLLYTERTHLGPSRVLPYVLLHLAGPNLPPLRWTVISSIAPSLVLPVHLENYETWAGSRGSPRFVASWSAIRAILLRTTLLHQEGLC